jgi:hypothetical protein
MYQKDPLMSSKIFKTGQMIYCVCGGCSSKGFIIQYLKGEYYIIDDLGYNDVIQAKFAKLVLSELGNYITRTPRNKPDDT